MKFLVYILLLFCFFPYIDIFKLGTDTQPNAFLLGALVLFLLKDKMVNKSIILLWLTFFLGVLLFFKNGSTTFLYFKNTLNYLAPPIVAMALYNLMIKLKMKVSFKMFFGVVMVYMIVALVQLYIDLDFMTFLITDGTRGNLHLGRGVISLCPEPAFYGSQCLFLMVVSLIAFDKKENMVLMPILLFQIVFLARSSTAIALLGGAFLLFTIYQIFKFRLTYIFTVLLICAITIPIMKVKVAELEKTRAGNLLMEFVEDPLLITKIDASVATRFTYFVAPFLSMKHNYFMPMGLGGFKPFIMDFYNRGMYRNFLDSYLVEAKEKISGSINMILFQLGFLGLMFPFAIYLAFKKLFIEEKAFFAFILFITMLFTQIQLMHSMTGFIIAYALTLSHNKMRPILKTA